MSKVDDQIKSLAEWTTEFSCWETWPVIYFVWRYSKKGKKNQSQGGNLKRFKKHLNFVQQNKTTENPQDCLYASQHSKLYGGNSRGSNLFYSAVRLFSSLCLDCFALLCQVSFFILLFLNLPWIFSSRVDKQHFLWAKVLHKLLGHFQQP